MPRSDLFCEENLVRETPLLTALNQILEQQTFLLGDQFSVADVAVGSFLHIPIMMKLDVARTQMS